MDSEVVQPPWTGYSSGLSSSGAVEVERWKTKEAVDQASDQQCGASEDWQLTKIEAQQHKQCWVETSGVVC